MPYNGVGQFTSLGAPTFPAVSNTFILASYFNATMNDIFDGLSVALPRDGQAAMTGNLNLAGFKLTSLANGVQSTDAVNFGQVFTGGSFTGASLTNTMLLGTVAAAAATSVTVPTPASSDNSSNAASTAFVQSVALNAALPDQAGNAGKVPTTDGTDVSWSALKTVNSENLLGAGDIFITSDVPVYLYENRDGLRGLTPIASAQVIVLGLGLFVWTSGLTELDDDETCFATATGVWLLEAAGPDYVNAKLTQGLDALVDEATAAGADAGTAAGDAVLAAKFLHGTFSMSSTSLATITSTSFTATVAGAVAGDSVIVNPGNSFGTTAADQGKLSYVAYVSAANTVTVTIRNASASTANMTASTWAVTVIKP